MSEYFEDKMSICVWLGNQVFLSIPATGQLIKELIMAV